MTVCISSGCTTRARFCFETYIILRSKVGCTRHTPNPESSRNFIQPANHSATFSYVSESTRRFSIDSPTVDLSALSPPRSSLRKCLRLSDVLTMPS